MEVYMFYGMTNEAFMTLMRKESLKLPKRWEGGDFCDNFERQYSRYINDLDGVISRENREIISDLCTRLLAVIRNYLNGYLQTAYADFSGIMDMLYLNPLKTYFKNTYGINGKFKDPLQLYRVRHVQGNALLKRSDIFHTPNNMRSRISTCRYSISGFPSLYLGTCLKLCVEESTPSLFSDQLIASRYEMVRNYYQNGNTEIVVFDMAIRPNDFVYYRNKNGRVRGGFEDIDLEDQAIRSNYLLWYPLLLGCSYIRINKAEPFAVEYILPQFVLQWFRSRIGPNELVGIRYFSCASNRASRMGFNYVFPVSGRMSVLDGQYCEILARTFKITTPQYLREFETIQEFERKLNCLVAKSLLDA
jgi:hypothetical protein